MKKTLTARQKVAQMIMIDFPGFFLEDCVKKHLKSIEWGGFILFAKNIRTPEELTSLNKELMGLGYDVPPYISIDQEGGLVCRVAFDGMHLSPGNMALGRIGDEDLTDKLCTISGVELRKFGFHLTFAPVADVNVNPENPIIGVRSFGENPEMVSKLTSASVRGYEKAGIASCAKHFPGHGDTSFDSHLSLASVNAAIERINQVELPPFYAAVSSGVPSIMTAHVMFPAIEDCNIPATLSKKILTGLLRKKMGFDGLIITDSMAMKAISDNFGIGEAAVMSVNAGADVVMMCGEPAAQLEAHAAILQALQEGRINEDTIDRAVERILRFKERYVINPPAAPELSPEDMEEAVEKASRRASTVLYDNTNVLPVSPEGRRAVVFSPDRLYATMLGEKINNYSIFPLLREVFILTDKITYNIDNPSRELIDSLSFSNSEVIFIELYSRGMLSEKNKKFAVDIINRAKEQTIPVIIISLSSPYGIPLEADAAAVSYTHLTLPTIYSV